MLCDKKVMRSLQIPSLLQLGENRVSGLEQHALDCKDGAGLQPAPTETGHPQSHI